MFTDLLSPAHVLTDLDVSDKDAVLAALVGALASSPAVRDPEVLLAAVRDREQQMSTGVGDGLALPHAHTDAVSEQVAALAILRRGIPFDAIDGKPVRIAVLLAGPASGRTGHVRLLSRVSRMLGQARVRQHLLAATGPREALSVLADAEASLV